MILPLEGPPRMGCPRFELGSLEASLGIEAQMLLWEEHESPYALTARALQDLGARRLAIDPALPFFVFNGLRLAAPAVELLDGAPVIDGCRMTKSPAELALRSQAKAMTLEVHRRAAAILAPGITTTAVRRFIDQAHRALGADDGSSFCAVQFGVASAYPHGLPGEQGLAEGDLVLRACRSLDEADLWKRRSHSWKTPADAAPAARLPLQFEPAFITALAALTETK